MKIFLSPHDDDHALFGAYTCMRERPVVVVITDSHIQPNRGEIGCSAEERAKETANSCQILGVDHGRLGLPDSSVIYGDILKKFQEMDKPDIEVVYAPMLQHGNPHHDMVAMAAATVFGDRVIYYPTYTRTELYTTAQNEVIPTKDEMIKKEISMGCYHSQIRINKVHFDALVGKSEWLNPTIQ